MYERGYALRGVLLSGLAFAVMNGATAQNSTALGSWNNSTFGTSGTIEVSAVTDDMDNVILTLNINGNVFGQGDPLPVSLNGVSDSDGIVFSKMDDPFFGDMLLRFDFDGQITVSFENIPAAGIGMLEATGQFQNGDEELNLDYTIYDPTGASLASGSVSGEQASGSPPDVLYFAQVGNGDGLSTQLVFPNPGEVEVNGTISFTNDDGEPVSFPVVAVSNPPDSSRPIYRLGTGGGIGFTVAPKASLTITTDGLGKAQVGSALVMADGQLGGVALFNLPGAGLAGVDESQPLDRFMTHLRRVEDGINTGVAIRNTTGNPIDVDLSLRQDGKEIATARLDSLPAHGHIARFFDQLFPGVDTKDFTGTLLATSVGGPMAATVLQLGPNPGEFASLPVVPLP